MLFINNLTVEVEKKEILKNFSLKINDGEIHILMGPNGAGKSSICKTIMHAPGYYIKNGNIIYNDINLNSLTTTEISRLGINLINQNPITIEGVTNAEMLRIALSEKNNTHIDIFSFNKKMENICSKLEIPKTFIHRNINDGMSGGERKKNELLHLWMLEPNFVILDEIDSGLDVDALKIVAHSLKEYHDTTKCSMLIVTHSVKLLDILKPDYVHILNNKEIVKTGDILLAKEIEKFGFNTINKADEIGENKYHE